MSAILHVMITMAAVAALMTVFCALAIAAATVLARLAEWIMERWWRAQ